MFNLLTIPSIKRVGVFSCIFFLAPGSESAYRYIALKKHSEGFKKPCGIVVPPNERSRLFIVEKVGFIKIVSVKGVISPIPFLDVSDRVLCDEKITFNCGEQGLLGLAFHPKYASNGRFFINFTQNDPPKKKGVPIVHTFVMEFKVDASNPDVADSTSGIVLLKISQPFFNHKAGDMTFGPDGYLYIATGDGGNQGDPQKNGQGLNTLLGKILRINVNGVTSGKNYSIPPDNPFVSDTSARSEIWAYGFRNPWRISFDRKSGDLYISDVGHQTSEEINYQPASSVGGENYGWSKMEGFDCYDSTKCNPRSPKYKLPIVAYPHDETGGCAVVGGYVYHEGSKETVLNGSYLYADFCSGKIWGTKIKNGKW
eukprot:CAMPEP_0194267436 /NCGR_PEP_ID=MMETSP0169-20130528/1935_1 /TAXON_ID=218684 /ORGANISM="Corethron pennatum, Strain L29A3" /LENGTH=368 /DNA_ID=CAMNT_0039008267 /DNA_START=69 /DNA_END=1172 /DNA_ORIENTATION=+